MVISDLQGTGGIILEKGYYAIICHSGEDLAQNQSDDVIK